MKKLIKVKIALLLLVTSSCNCQSKNNAELSTLLDKCKTNPTKENFQLFFKIFPDSYNKFQSIFGYSDQKGAALHYDDGENYLVTFFKSSQSVDKEAFINKLIEISKGGKWDADNVNSFQEKMRKYFFENYKTFLVILDKRNNADIKMFWYFFSDQPVFDKKNHAKILNLLDTNERIKKIYLEAVEKVKKDNIH